MNKLPWWGQLLVFAFVGAGHRRRLLLHRTSGRSAAELDVRAAPNSPPSRAASPRAWRRRASCRSSARRSATSKARLESLKAILPEEKDVADLLRRMQTLASQSNLTIRALPAARRRHQGAARRVADRTRTRRHVSQRRAVPRPRQQVPAHHQRRLDRDDHRAPPPSPIRHRARRPARRRPSCCTDTDPDRERRHAAVPAKKTE